jgi:hypothetical protein
VRAFCKPATSIVKCMRFESDASLTPAEDLYVTAIYLCLVCTMNSASVQQAASPTVGPAFLHAVRITATLTLHEVCIIAFVTHSAVCSPGGTSSASRDAAGSFASDAPLNTVTPAMTAQRLRCLQVDELQAASALVVTLHCCASQHHQPM